MEEENELRNWIKKKIKLNYVKHNSHKFIEQINSPSFSIQQAMILLNSTFNNEKIKILLGLLERKFFNQIIEYLPELIIQYNQDASHSQIENLFLSKCVDHVKFSIIICWVASSYFEKNKKEKLQKLPQNILETFVNKSEQSLYQITNSVTLTNIELQKYYNKIRKQVYFHEVNQFYNELSKLSLSLVDLAREDQKDTFNRNDQLRLQIEVLNNMIQKLREHEYNKNMNKLNIDSLTYNFFYGIILPFNDSEYSSDDHNTLILKIIPELSMCISTKYRVPLKLVCECIDTKDTANWTKLYLPKAPTAKQVKQTSKKNNDPFGEDWNIVTDRFKQTSHFKNFPSYSLKSFIYKANDDLRQEMMIMEMIRQFQYVFDKEEIPIKLRPYHIQITSASSGLMEFVPNSISISSLKKKLDAEYGNRSLSKFFSIYFKGNVEKATNNFIQSLAGYSLITYLLNIKDRHNGNILMINTGEIIHIDFGYSLGLTPAGVGFEKAPFKLTKGFLEIIGDENSTNFFNFKSLFCQGLIAARKYYDIFQNILITMSKSGLSCFEYMPVVEMLKQMEKRFLVKTPEDKLVVEIERIIQDAAQNWRTKTFDKYNKCLNGIQ